MGKRKEMRDDAIAAADLFMSNVDTILEKYRTRVELTAEDCLDAIATELHSGVWDTVEEALDEIQGE
jgi:hypothetical protein